MTRTLREALDTTVSPCDDFEQYANGGWRARYPTADADIFSDVKDRTNQKLIGILDNARREAKLTQDPLVKALGYWYASCLTADSVDVPKPKRASPTELPNDRPSQCLASADAALGPALGRAFKDAVLSESAANELSSRVAHIIEAIRAEILQIGWVPDSIKTRTLAVLDDIDIVLNGFIESTDYRPLELVPDDYVENRRRLNEFRQQHARSNQSDLMGRLLSMGVLPHRYRAFSMPSERILVLTTVLLQPPFYDTTAEAAANYANLGMVLGHEIWHILVPTFKWMTTEDGIKRANVLIDQYDKLGESGWISRNENFSDLGSLLAAYAAWERYEKANAMQEIEGFTADQRFFLYYARLWRGPVSKSRDVVHASPRARVNGVVMQTPAFAKAFGCREGAPMAPSKDRRTTFFNAQKGE